MHKYRKRSVAIATLVMMLTIVGGTIWFIAPWQSPQHNPDNFCPLNGEYARTAVLVDATDSLNDKQIKEVVENINKLRRNMQLHEWMGIFVLKEDDLILPKPIIALCNPGNKTTANPLYQNPEQIQRDFEAKFRQPMEEALHQLVNLPEQSQSPILEMIYAVALDKNFDSTQKRRLIIISDMLQNVAEYSHYRGDNDYNEWRAMDYARQFLDTTLLRSVDVDIVYVKRGDESVRALQTYGHLEFWKSYFHAVGARLASVTPI